MGIYLPYHCFSRLCRKLAKPRVINRVEQVSGNCVKDHRCLASTKKPRGTQWVPLGFFVMAEVSEPCEFCVLKTYGKALCCGRKTSATFPRFCGAKQRLLKPLRGNSTDFAAGERPRFPSPPRRAPARRKTGVRFFPDFSLGRFVTGALFAIFTKKLSNYGKCAMLIYTKIFGGV